MTCRTELLTVLTLCVLATFAAPAEAKPVVLTIHGGGYYLGSAADMEPIDDVFERRGYEAVPIAYRLEDVGAGWTDVKAVADSFGPRRRVFAFGMSSGGGYAAKLAERGIVDAAYGLYPLVRIRGEWTARTDRFDCLTVRCRRRFSPALRRPANPFRALVPLEDTVVDPADVLAWADRERKVTAITFHGEHGSPSPAGFWTDIANAARWFRTR